MIIYFGLIGFLFLISFFIKKRNIDRDKQDSLILVLTIGAMYLICVLRKSTVGIDTASYETMYEMSGYFPWDNFSFSNFEYGYILLMKVFAKLGFSFQLFLAVIYAYIFLPLYFFIKKYSKDVTLSLLIYICYQFFVFNLSGIRQSLATGICLLAFRF